MSSVLPEPSTASTTETALAERLAAITSLSGSELRAEWRRLYRKEPPRMSRDLLIRGLAYRLQELRFGGLPKVAQRQLEQNVGADNGTSVTGLGSRLRHGQRLVREWHGRTHSITVLDEGFLYEGKTYPSLTKIAGLITGAHWSGPRFFGLVSRPEANLATDTLRQDSSGEGNTSHG